MTYKVMVDGKERIVYVYCSSFDDVWNINARVSVMRYFIINEGAKDVEVLDYDLTDGRPGEHLDISFETPWDDFYARQKEEVAKTEEEKRVCDMLYAGKGYIECMHASTMSNDEFRDFYQRLADWETAHCVKETEIIR